MENKKDWSSEKKINYILGLQDKGLSRKDIAADFGYTRVDTLDRLMKKYGYEKIDGKFVLSMEDNSPTSIKNEVISMVKDGCPPYGGQLLGSSDVQTKLINIVNNYDKLMYVINNFGKMKDSCPIDVIEVKSGLQIDFKKSEVIKTTIRVDKDIWDDFSDLCKDKYKHLNKHDIISKAFIEFMDKYK
ncbi:hypothetical protein [Paraclostridium sordellii]|uniref:hypothetical protein n=1 Tax=Paraclostridium sordellii TaxID=1505 RepID=UPI000385B376|nr:hypothetical protein [Paeniclostridium sordellii]EPZ61627.1 hypothetical protein H476_3626 [[Clostridium] sordellii VPI 9048] [Paeniclostridium sordellii VPI 9048]CEK39951.1 Transcriptional regulator, repressor-like [[Clostridium] sordellii] [Paeniclostridium sordellii]